MSQCRETYSLYSSNLIWPESELNNIFTTTTIIIMKVKITENNHSCSRSWKPIGLWHGEDHTFSRQTAHRWRLSCQSYAPATLYPQGTFLVSVSIRNEWCRPLKFVFTALISHKCHTVLGLDVRLMLYARMRLGFMYRRLCVAEKYLWTQEWVSFMMLTIS
jgi:hypothetical protein